MSVIETSLMNTLGHALDLTVVRQRIVAENVANIDTPGYQTRDLDFRHELQRAVEGDSDAPGAPLVHAVPNLEQRPDGNNVSIDRESLSMPQKPATFSTCRGRSRKARRTSLSMPLRTRNREMTVTKVPPTVADSALFGAAGISANFALVAVGRYSRPSPGMPLLSAVHFLHRRCECRLDRRLTS